MKFLKIFIFFLTIIIPLLTAFFLYQKFLNTSSCLDGLSHLYIAKNIIHNGKYSTIKNLGTCWLPLYHLLLIPFVFFDNLYFTGFAGAILNILILFLIIYFLFKLLPHPYSLFSSLLFLFYPYLLIYTISPMTEILTIFFLILTFYYFLKDDLSKLIIVVNLGTLTRYEFYPIAFFLFFFYLRKSKKVFLFFLGIIFWLIWNYFLYSDPFYFYNHPVIKDTCGILPYAYNLKNLLNFNIKILKELFGYLPIISFLSFLYLIHKKYFKIILLLLPLFIHFLLEYLNISLGYSRFYLLSLPFFTITPFFSLQNLKNNLFKILTIFLIFFNFFFNLPIFSILSTGKNHYDKKFPYGHHLDINYPIVKEKILYFQDFFKDINLKNKRILIPSCQEFQVFSFALKIRPENIFDAYDKYDRYEKEIIKIMKEPEKYCDLVVIENNLNDFSFRFHKFFNNNYYNVLFYQDEDYQKKFLNNFYLLKKDRIYSLYLKK
ncbi:MAG: hypothetical protein N2323_00960 [candidate division WOR-3 bacterium]|nr:hypothetical protein [candidate division WOR-3 bacterium]MCX7836515.1 hypothetical protein [candidate division WOR-3 bacterium]MDW8113753.1 hypothetical protein [candidate division WOR-3 bacterium]